MGNDLFRMSQQKGIYHTFSMWSRLSPNLAKGEHAKAGIKSAENTPETELDDRSNKESPVEFSSSD